jgi:periplasmic protein TonB
LSKDGRLIIPRATGAPGTSTSGRRHQRLLQLSPVPATPYVEPLSIGPGRRALAISLAVLIPGFLLLMLLSFGPEKPPRDSQERLSVVSIEATEAPAEAPEQSAPEHKQAEERTVSPRPASEEPLPPQAAEPKAAPTIVPPAALPPSPVPPSVPLRPSGGRVYGPPNTGSPSSSGDSERVGTAPNGEPLYAATWYREPGKDELRGYLSTADGPGWGLIACRTAPDYRVEDCVGLDEYPYGSQINRAVLAAAWQFRVRPPRRGGRLLVGSWVRIRIDYSIGRR